MKIYFVALIEDFCNTHLIKIILNDFCIIYLKSCKNRIFEDNTVTESMMKGDKKHGIEKIWKIRNKLWFLQAVFNYKNGLLENEQRMWYPGGFLNKSLFYSKNIQTGPQTGWYNNGYIRYFDSYLDGNKHGASIYWTFDGKILLERIYDNGICIKIV